MQLRGRYGSTLQQYRQHVDLHILDLLGDSKIATLTTPDVEAFKDRLLKTRSHAMAKKVLTSFKSILSEGQRRGLVAQNVAATVKVPAKRKNGRPEIPTKAEVSKILAKADGNWRPIIVMAIFTGMRSSELRALRWEDVDLDERVVRVRQRADRWGAMAPPKSEAGERVIPMTNMVRATLGELRLKWRPDAELVFPTQVMFEQDAGRLSHDRPLRPAG